jgi:hypothetical protein
MQIRQQQSAIMRNAAAGRQVSLVLSKTTAQKEMQAAVEGRRTARSGRHSAAYSRRRPLLPPAKEHGKTRYRVRAKSPVSPRHAARPVRAARVQRKVRLRRR